VSLVCLHAPCMYPEQPRGYILEHRLHEVSHRRDVLLWMVTYLLLQSLACTPRASVPVLRRSAAERSHAVHLLRMYQPQPWEQRFRGSLAGFK